MFDSGFDKTHSSGVSNNTKLLLVFAGLFLASCASFIIYLFYYSSLFNGNNLAIGSNAPTTASITVPVFKPVDFNNLSRREILRLREASIKAVPLLKTRYNPNREIFGGIESGARWYSLAGLFVHGVSEKSSEGLTAESRNIINPYLLVAPEFWGITIWKDTGAVWNKKKTKTVNIYSPDFPLAPLPYSLVWQPSANSAVVTYKLGDFIQNINEFTSKPVVNKRIATGLSAVNARDLGFNYIAVDKGASTNMEIPDKAITPLESTDKFSGLKYICGKKFVCNHSDIPIVQLANLVINKLPAKIVTKLWQTNPLDVNKSADMTFVINIE